MREQSVAKGFAVLSAAGIIVKLLSLLYLPVLIAIVGEEGNGVYAAAYQVYVLVYAISNVGIPVAVSKLVSELIAVGNPKDAVRGFKIARFLLLLMGIFSGALMALLSGPLANVMHYEKAHLAILALSPSLIFTAIASAYRGYFQGRSNMTPTAVSQILEQVVNTILTLVFAALLIKKGIPQACAGGTIGTSIGALVSASYLINFYNKKGGMVISEQIVNMDVQRYSYSQLLKKVIGYSIPITLTIGMQYAGNLVDVMNTKVRLLAAGFADKPATELYSHLYKYQQLLNAPIAIMAALAATILPAISAAVALRDRKRIQNRVSFAMRVCFFITIPSALGLSILSDSIYRIIRYGPGSELMLWGSVCLVMLAVVQIQTSILQGAGKLYGVTLNLVFGIIGKIVTNYFLISIKGLNIYGAIIGSIVGYSISITLNNILIKKTLFIKTKTLQHAVKPIISAVAMGLAVLAVHAMVTGVLGYSYFVNFFGTILSILVGIAVYFVVLVYIKGITKEELEIIPGRLRKFVPRSLMLKIG
ncbi:MAG: polysaccharide biosynthesis protein [Bacillota bacterium]|nr:polysaccharide biosynthesis protein [Bacillota bacterium]